MQRAHALKFRGKVDANGRPDRYFPFAPARDLDASDIANLTNAEYAEAISGDKPLYVEVKKPEEKKPESKADEKKPDAPAPKDPPPPDAPSGK